MQSQAHKNVFRNFFFRIANSWFCELFFISIDYILQFCFYKDLPSMVQTIDPSNTTGSPKNTTAVIFVHGMRSHVTNFIPLIYDMKKKYYANSNFNFDIYEHSYQDIPDISSGSDALAATIQKILDKNPYTSIILIGHSYGGRLIHSMLNTPSLNLKGSHEHAPCIKHAFIVASPIRGAEIAHWFYYFEKQLPQMASYVIDMFHLAHPYSTFKPDIKSRFDRYKYNDKNNSWFHFFTQYTFISKTIAFLHSILKILMHIIYYLGYIFLPFQYLFQYLVGLLTNIPPQSFAETTPKASTQEGRVKHSKKMDKKREIPITYVRSTSDCIVGPKEFQSPEGIPDDKCLDISLGHMSILRSQKLIKNIHDAINKSPNPYTLSSKNNI